MATESSLDHGPKPDQRILTDLVRRVVEAVHPLRIILFGSGARGEMNTHSDLDVLVVMPDGVHRRRTAQTICRSLAGLGIAKDIVVVTERDVHEHGKNPSLVLCPALTQGKELYHAEG
jgi:predicted nucleotidyltransferase